MLAKKNQDTMEYTHWCMHKQWGIVVVLQITTNSPNKITIDMLQNGSAYDIH